MYGSSLHGNREISSVATGEKPSGPHREGAEPKPVMHALEKSDAAIVAVKQANAGGRPPGESVEPRAAAKGNAVEDGMLRTQRREGMSHGLGRVRQPRYVAVVIYPRWEPDALIGPVRFCAGGAQ
jgi:hypothetical protein